MPRGKVYVINSPNLAISVQRLPTKISFWHVEAIFTGSLAGLSPFATKTLANNVHSEDGQPSYLREGMANAHAAMKPGEVLTITTKSAAEMLAASIGRLQQKSTAQIELGRWVTDELMAAVTGSIFGSRNPYRDPEIGRSFW